MGKGKTGPSLTTRSKSGKQKETEKDGTTTSNPIQAPRPSSLDKRKGRTKKVNPTPIWIQYYKNRSQESGTYVNRGWGLPINQFESFMDQFAGEEDNLYEILKQNPEVGSFLYADGSGRMRVIHHLSPVIHGKSLIVGVEGFGASGEVKVVNCELFVAEIKLEGEAGEVEVPPLLDFVKFDLIDVKPPKTNPKDEAREVLTMSQILDGQPKAYFLHPRWLELVHKFTHEKPSSK